MHKIKHLLIVTSTINLEVFNALKLEQTKLTLVTMTMQDHATLKEIKDLAKNITLQYGTPDLCIEAMRKKNLKTMIFISQLKAKTNFQVVGLTMKCYSPLCKRASRMDQNLRAPVPMTWAFISDISTVCIPPALVTVLTVTLPVIAPFTLVVAIPF